MLTYIFSSIYLLSLSLAPTAILAARFAAQHLTRVSYLE